MFHDVLIHRRQQVITERQAFSRALTDLVRGDFQQGSFNKADFGGDALRRRFARIVSVAQLTKELKGVHCEAVA